jgi:uncharacterized membrane protein
MTDASSIIKTTDNIIELECREAFINKEFNPNDPESLCTRVIRKKFKCIMLLLLILFLMLLNKKENVSSLNDFLSKEYD